MTLQNATPTAESVHWLVHGLDEEYTAFAALVEPLDEPAWTTPTRCTGWEVRDVTGHVVLDVVESLDGTVGTRTPDEQAKALRDHSPAEVAALLRESAPKLRALLQGLGENAWAAPSPVAGRTIYNGVLTLWYDTFVHANDIRAALGRPEWRGPGLAAGVTWLRDELERLGRGPLTLELDGLPRRSVGAGGPTVTGDPMRFVLAASGRADPAALGLDESVNVHLLP